jgi:hypothetical protein
VSLTSVALALFTLIPQEPPISRQSSVHVFLDCQAGDCHEDFLRDEIAFVEYVRDRADADVHLLITDTRTGSGGLEFSLSFIGLGRFTGTNYNLKATSSLTDPRSASGAASRRPRRLGCSTTRPPRASRRNSS